MPRPNNVGVGTALIILNSNNEVLLMKRAGAHGAGIWALPGGWMDATDESTVACVIREAMEEIGLDVHVATPYKWTTEWVPELQVRTVTLFHYTKFGQWTGVPLICEPEKCTELRWFSMLRLPSQDNLFSGCWSILNTNAVFNGFNDVFDGFK